MSILHKTIFVQTKLTFLLSLFLSKKLHSVWLQKRPFRLFSHSLDFARKYGNVTDIRFLLLPRPVTSQHDFRHRFASRFTVRSHANRFLTSLRPPWINLNRSFTSSDSNVSRFLEFHNYRILQIHVCSRKTEKEEEQEMKNTKKLDTENLIFFREKLNIVVWFSIKSIFLSKKKKKKKEKFQKCIFLSINNWNKKISL